MMSLGDFWKVILNKKIFSLVGIIALFITVCVSLSLSLCVARGGGGVRVTPAIKSSAC